jgi:uncharacterized protein (DUF433 family)
MCANEHMCAQASSRQPKGPRGICLSEELQRAIQHEADTGGHSWSAMTAELLDEPVRMRRVPGIVFVDGATGHRAVITGTGLDVWEVIATWKDRGEDDDALKQAFSWRSPMQLRSVLSYYQVYPQEIDVRLECEAQWSKEHLHQRLPFAAPSKADT